MKTTFLKQRQLLLASITILAAIATSPMRSVANPANDLQTDPVLRLQQQQTTEQQQGTPPVPKADRLPGNAQKVNSGKERTQPEQNTSTENEPGFFGIPWALILNAGSSILGLSSLLLAFVAYSRATNQREEVMRLKGRYQDMLKRLGSVEVQMEQDRMVSRNPSIDVSAPIPAAIPTPVPSAPPTWTIPQATAETPSVAEPISKATLINALNIGDRQPLRAASTAELNITSESENALAMGKAIATELEEVAGGGSYWLIAAEGQDWLFPTDRTLRGFAAAQPSKGLFHYEQQTIAQPRLMEPALLERSGSRWIIKTMGKIGLP
jgi:hypothetical protein